MRILLTFSIVLMFIIPVKGQKQLTQYLDNYKHTINDAGRKITLHVGSDDEKLVSVDASRTYHWYSNNKIMVTQGGYGGKLLHGAYKSYYPNSNMQEQGRFKSGLKTGEWINWFESGHLSTRTSYRNGLATGFFYKYDDQGGILEKGKFRKDKLHGKVIKYQGDSVVRIRYKNGVMIEAGQRKGPRWLISRVKNLFKGKPDREKPLNQEAENQN